MERLRAIVEFEPPMSAPRVPVTVSVEFAAAKEVVATLAKVFAPEKYGMLPTTAAEEVERPLKAKAPVLLLYESGKDAESDDEEILPAKVDQSVDDRSPLLLALADGMLKVMVEPLPVMVKSEPVVEVAKVAVPLVVWLSGPTARTPVLESEPPESWRPVPIVVVARAFVPLPVRSVFAAIFDQPVPPFDTPRMPEMSEVSEMSEVETAPAVALRKPERLAMESVPVVRFVLLAYAVEMPVEEAYERFVCPLNVLAPVKRLESASKVDDAKDQVEVEKV